MKYLFILLLLAGFVPVTFSQSQGLTVVIIRHGEKNEATGNLSCQGLHRAMSLPKVLNTKFKQFAYVFVPTLSKGKMTGHARMFQTITPTAVQYNLPLDSKYTVSATDDVAKEVMKKTGIVLLVWEHDNIPAIAKALGVKGKLSWGNTDFDSIWIINYVPDKKGNLKANLTYDKEGLTPPAACNF